MTPPDIALLYREHAAFIARTLQRLTLPGPHVDDLLQETFIVAWQKRARFRAGAEARPWLYGIAANLARRHRRSLFRFLRTLERWSSEPIEPNPRPDETLERAQLGTTVHAVLQKLPLKQREVFVLYELEGLSGREIAELIQMPIATVWTRLHHARKRFTLLMAPRRESRE